MDIYDITYDIKHLYELYENEEIDEQTYRDSLESLGLEMAIEEHIKMIRNAEAAEKAITSEINKLKEKAESEKVKANFAKLFIIDCLNSLNKKKIQTNLFKVTKCSSKSADITNISLISETYLEPQPPKVNKKAILDDLKAGKEVNGARLKESAYIRIT